MNNLVRWIEIALVGVLSQSLLFAQGAPVTQGPSADGSPSAVVSGSENSTKDVRGSAVLDNQFKQPCPSATTFSQEEIMNRREVQVASHHLLAITLANKRMRVMFVTFKNGEFGFVRWPYSARMDSETWKGPLPECTVAIVRTNSAEYSEEPSVTDHDLADGRQAPAVTLPVYVLHLRGISKAVPGKSEAVYVRDSLWINEFAPTRVELEASKRPASSTPHAGKHAGK